MSIFSFYLVYYILNIGFVPCIGDVSTHSNSIIRELLFVPRIGDVSGVRKYICPDWFVPCIGDVSVGEHVNLELRLFSLYRGCF